jgi:hypothetical protein
MAQKPNYDSEEPQKDLGGEATADEWFDLLDPLERKLDPSSFERLASSLHEDANADVPVTASEIAASAAAWQRVKELMARHQALPDGSTALSAREELGISLLVNGKAFDLTPVRSESGLFAFGAPFSIRRVLAMFERDGAEMDEAVILVRRAGAIAETLLRSFTDVRSNAPQAHVAFQAKTRGEPQNAAGGGSARPVLRTTLPDGTMLEILTDDSKLVYVRVVDKQ